jgi:hypothetical protein
MKPSQKIKEILIEMAIECTLPSDMNELDTDVFACIDEMLPDESEEWNGYTLDSIVEHLEDNDNYFTKKNASEVLEILKHKSDANMTHWDNLDMAYDRWQESKENS